MKKSTRVGLTLALGLTMSSSFMMWDNDTKTSWPFGLQSAQASVNGSTGNLNIFAQRPTTSQDTALQERRMSALVSRVRKRLANRKNAALINR